MSCDNGLNYSEARNNLSTMVRHSKVQKQILSLYREFLKISKAKPGMTDYIRNEFKKNAAIPRTETLHIEHLFRRGQRQLQMLQRQDVQGVGVFTEDSGGKGK